MNKEKSDCELVHNSLHALQENHSSDDDSMACYGVNLAFLREFMKLNQIPSNMTTAEVVEQFIKPQTSESQSAFLTTILSEKKFWTDLRPGRRKIEGKKVMNCYFLSHCWQMPFHCLVNSVENATEIKHNFFTNVNERTWNYYFWIDVFCKNQHVPAPAMDEFKNAMKASGIL
jgi:hypothetical protein